MTSQPAAALHPVFASILDRHMALPVGPYPAAKWPAGLPQEPAALQALRVAVEAQINAQRLRDLGQYAPNVKLKDVVLAVEPRACVGMRGRRYRPSINGRPLGGYKAEAAHDADTGIGAWLNLAQFIVARDGVVVA